MISIHTFELTLNINTKEYNSLLSSAYKMAKENKNRLGYSTKYTTGDVRIDDALASKGITVQYHNYEFRKMIKLCINPSKVLGGSELKLWKPNRGNIEELTALLNQYIDGYFDSEYDMNSFELSRIDFTANIDVGEKNVSSYIRLMYKIGKVKNFVPKYTKSDFETKHINKKHSFDLKGKTNGIEFTAYDKEADFKKAGKRNKAEKAKGILRIEVRLTTRKSVKKVLETFTTDQSLWTEEEFQLLAEHSTEIFWSRMAQIVPFGDFYRLKETEQRILDSDLKPKKKEKMLCLIRLIAKRKSLYQALKEVNVRKSEEILLWFAKINVSPITISAREEIDFLENLYSYFEE